MIDKIDNNIEDEDSEETSKEDKTSDENNEEEGSESDDLEPKDSKRSDIIQKIKYREKFDKSRQKVKELEKQLSELREMVKKPSDDAEAKAQEYIRGQARAVFEDLQKAKKDEEEENARELQEQVDSILDDNPDISEEELLDAIEEYEVEPKVALKILKKSSDKKPKPKMPQPRRAVGSETKEKPDDTKKTMWQILQEEASKLKGK